MEATLDAIFQRTKRVGDCLEWQRCFNSDGYPRAAINGDTNVKVHRKVFELCHGYSPPVVRHKCDNIKCVEPAHLLPGTHIDNVQDRVLRGRTNNHLSEEEKQLILSLRNQGLRYKEIARQLNCSVKRVDSTLYRFRRVIPFVD